jgi:hypothetical protein
MDKKAITINACGSFLKCSNNKKIIVQIESPHCINSVPWFRKRNPSLVLMKCLLVLQQAVLLYHPGKPSRLSQDGLQTFHFHSDSFHMQQPVIFVGKVGHISSV